MIHTITWRTWLLTALARKLGFTLFANAAGDGGRAMLFATSKATARDTCQHFMVHCAMAEMESERARPVVSADAERTH